MIFIPDAESSLPATKRPLWEFEDEAVTSGPAGPHASPSLAGREAGPESDPAALPAWWVEHEAPGSVARVTATRLAELEGEARRLLRRLEDDKVLQGRDYSLDDLGRLAMLGQEAGPSLAVTPSTANGRDEMLRRGVQAALEAAMAAQSGDAPAAGGALPLPPAPFVCRLAGALGVPVARAAAVVRAELAATARAEIIAAEAAARQGEAGGVVRAARHLARSLAAFPLPRGSAEAELVARSVRLSAGLEVRKRLFVEAGSGAGGAAAHALAELLGFDPELVVPQLLG